MENIEKLELLATDFKDTDFWSDNCAIGKAIYRRTSERVTVGCSRITFSNGTVKKFDQFGPSSFEADAEQAAQHNYDTTVIRTITFI